MSGKHLRQSPNGRRMRRAMTVSLVAAGLLGATAPAMAAKGGGATAPPSGSCSAAPSPVPVGTDYTLTGRGLGAYTIVNVLVSDSAGTTSWNLQADANGTTAVVGRAYWTGTSKVTFQTGRRNTVVASCSFSVV